jgi:hypothetical protein
MTERARGGAVAESGPMTWKRRFREMVIAGEDPSDALATDAADDAHD